MECQGSKGLACHENFHRGISEQRLPQHQASKYLFVLADAAEFEFSGCEYICGGNLVTYLSVTRARVRTMYVSAAYRLSTYLVDRINRRRNRYTRLSTSLQPFSTNKSIFYPSELDQFYHELVYVFERYDRFNVITICRIALMRIQIIWYNIKSVERNISTSKFS